MCFAYAYSDADGVSVNLFSTRKERDTAVRDILNANFFGTNIPVPFAKDATAETAWDTFCNTDTPDFYLAFADL